MLTLDSRLAGPIKLLSSKGTLLGTITCPVDWVRDLGFDDHQQSAVMLRIWPTGTVMVPLGMNFGDRHRPMEQDFWTFRISACPHWWFALAKIAVRLHDISLEEFKQLPGCSFHPITSSAGREG